MTNEWGAGRVVAGKYRLVAKLGEGGMGAVWRADHVTLGSPVAVKLINQSQLDSEDGVRRFLNEARAAALLRSPHVVQILDHGVDDDVPFMVMEMLEGESLAARLARAGTLPLPEVSRLVTHVARAMTKAHEAGIVHRDLKPDNIFLVHNDDEELAKVLDFGIAKMTHGLAESAQKLSTRTGALLGTPYYMSPEQVRGHAIDWRTDLWALAVIAYECVTGRVPFDADTVGDLLLKVCSEPLPPAPPGVPAAFDAWFRKAVARPREERFQSAREMAEALRAIAADGTLAETGRFSPGAGASNAKAHAETIAAPSAAEGATPPESEVGIAPTLDLRATPVKLETMAGASVPPPTAREAPRRRTAVVAAGVVAAAALALWLAVPRHAPARSDAPNARAGAASATVTAPLPVVGGTEAPAIEPAVTPAASAQPTPAAEATASASAAPPASARVPATAAPPAAKPPRVAPPKATAVATPPPPPAPPPAKPKVDPLAF